MQFLIVGEQRQWCKVKWYHDVTDTVETKKIVHSKEYETIQTKKTTRAILMFIRC